MNEFRGDIGIFLTGNKMSEQTGQNCGMIFRKCHEECGHLCDCIRGVKGAFRSHIPAARYAMNRGLPYANF